MKKFPLFLLLFMTGFAVISIAVSVIFNVQLGSFGSMLFKIGLFSILPALVLATHLQDKKNHRESTAWAD